MHRVLFPPAHIANDDVKHIFSIIVISIAAIAGVLCCACCFFDSRIYSAYHNGNLNATVRGTYTLRTTT